MRQSLGIQKVSCIAAVLFVLASALLGTRASGAYLKSSSAAESLVSTGYLAQKMDQYHTALDVYTDSDAPGNHFLSRGMMSSPGDEASILEMNEKCTVSPRSGIDCIEAGFKSTGSNYNGWYFLNGTLTGSETQPDPNWGDTANAGVDLTGATKLTFWARGKVGGERVAFMCFGVGWNPVTETPDKPYPDSSPKASTGYVTLTDAWTKYTIDVSGLDKSYVLGGFAWITSASENSGNDITFYLDDISYDKPRLTEPRFILSYETIQSGYSFDTIMRNVAYTYDNAVALLAFTASGEMDRAKLLADALVYAQQNDRYYTDGRIRNAYQAGDLVPPAGWTPHGKTGTVRMPGWYDSTNKKWEEDSTQVGTQTGNVAWAMLSLISYYKAAGGDKYLDAAKQMGEWVEAHCRDTRGAGGYTAGFEGWEPDQTALTYKSTEHNIDLYAAFERLYEITGDATWHERSEHAKSFLLSMWDATEKKFWTGTGDDGVNVNTSVVPTDIQSWALLALGEDGAAYTGALDYAESHNKVGEGYDFNSDCDGVWYEGTAQMAEVFGSRGENGKWDSLVSFIEGAHFADGATPASSIDGLTTGFDLADGSPWLYYHRAHVGATGWLALAELRFNPFLMAFDNPLPVVTSLDPAHKTAGDPDFTLTVNGTNFISASTVNWNGSPRTTTYINDTRLTASIPASDIATTGTASVTVFTPAPGGGTSSAQTFTIAKPKPSITKLSPTSGTTGSYIYVYGTNFEGSRGSSYVEFGSTRVSTYSSWSSTKIKVKVPSGISRTCSVVVHTPGGTSNFKTFKVTPAISSISPTSGKVGSKLTISGRSFGSKRYSSSYVKFGSKTVSSYTSWSNTKIVVNVPSGITGTVSVKVTTSGGTSNGLAFTVK